MRPHQRPFGALRRITSESFPPENSRAGRSNGGHFAQDEDGFLFQRVQVLVGEAVKVGGFVRSWRSCFGFFMFWRRAGRIPGGFILPPPAAGAEVLARRWRGCRARSRCWGRTGRAGVVVHLVFRGCSATSPQVQLARGLILARFSLLSTRGTSAQAPLLAAQAGDPGVLALRQGAPSGSILRMPQQALRKAMLLYMASRPSRATNCTTDVHRPGKRHGARLATWKRASRSRVSWCSAGFQHEHGMSRLQAVDQVADDHVFGAQAGGLGDGGDGRIADRVGAAVGGSRLRARLRLGQLDDVVPAGAALRAMALAAGPGLGRKSGAGRRSFLLMRPPAARGAAPPVGVAPGRSGKSAFQLRLGKGGSGRAQHGGVKPQRCICSSWSMSTSPGGAQLRR